ncbi:MAG: Protein OS-9 [Alyxoria varia]|nr:MAG: Protein OS-9 [Alyxoria varia]
MFKSFWILPVTLRVALAAHHPFSVRNDLLAYPQYEVIFSESFIPEHEAQARFEAQSARQSEKPQADITYQQSYVSGSDDNGEHDQSERMVLDGIPYMCRIPSVPPETPGNKTSDPSEREHRQQELIRASHHGKELLAGLEGNCLFYPAGWWMYAFCYNNNIRQFHSLPPGRGVPAFPPVEDPNVPAFVLGKYKNTRKGDMDSRRSSSETELSTQLQTSGGTNYLVQKLGDGTTCDLTGRERRIEVQFHCNPGAVDRIAMIKETASCVYMMIIETPRLCNDMAFLPPHLDKPNPISCQEILAPQDEHAWKASKAAAALESIFNPQEGGNFQEGESVQEGLPQRPIIGGIEVGAQKLVGGSRDRVIKVSNIAKPAAQRPSQEEKFIATLASSDGKYTTRMSDREIQRRGLNIGREEYDKFIQDVENWAGEGEPWSLDVVQTSKGIVYEAKMTKEEPAGKERQDTNSEDGGGDRKEKDGRDESKHTEKHAEETGSTEEYR